MTTVELIPESTITLKRARRTFYRKVPASKFRKYERKLK